MTDDDKKEVKITFAPGCFDSFEGTQEELDDLIKEINTMAESGELMDMAESQSFDIETLIDNDPETAMRLMADTGQLQFIVEEMEKDETVSDEEMQEMYDLMEELGLNTSTTPPKRNLN